MYILGYCNIVHPLHFLFVLLYSSSEGGVYCFTPVCLKVLPSVPWNFYHIFLRNYKPELSVHGFILCDTISDSLHINILVTKYFKLTIKLSMYAIPCAVVSDSSLINSLFQFCHIFLEITNHSLLKFGIWIHVSMLYHVTWFQIHCSASSCLSNTFIF